MTITLNFDPVLTFVSGSPTPTSVTGNTITWSLAQLNSFAHRDVHAQFGVPPDVNLIGSDMVHTATVGIVQPETELANNSLTLTRTITGSFDPNAKEVKTSTAQSDSYYIIDEDEWLDYTIHFQNTGNDTAFFVVITDTLPSTVDPSTFEFGTASHSVIREMTGQGILRFIFPNILLPDSNVNEPASHGSVSFRIKPYEPILPGTVIENIANIYFDYNEPVITEPSVLVAEFSTGMDIGSSAGPRVFPNPTSGSISIFSSGGTVEQVELMSMDGRLLRTVREQTTRVTMDLTDLASGHYLLRVTERSGATFTRPVQKW